MQARIDGLARQVQHLRQLVALQESGGGGGGVGESGSSGSSGGGLQAAASGGGRLDEARFEARFDSIDANGDGVISREEYAAYINSQQSNSQVPAKKRSQLAVAAASSPSRRPVLTARERMERERQLRAREAIEVSREGEGSREQARFGPRKTRPFTAWGDMGLASPAGRQTEDDISRLRSRLDTIAGAGSGRGFH